jgi:hypothetical protein
MRLTEPKGRPSQSVPIQKIFAALVIASTVTAGALSAASSIVEKQDQPAIALTGIVSDTMCGRTHGTKAHGDAECTRTCVELGAGYALAVGKKVYILQGHRTELDRFAGDEVLVKGKVLSRDTVAVESVAPVIVDAFSRHMIG